MKKTILIILTLAIFVVPGLILADNDSTISYLQAQNQNTWISQSLASAAVTDVDISYMDYSTDNLMTAAKNILTLAATDSTDIDNLNRLLTVIEASKNNGQYGSADLLNDDFWSLIALASINELKSADSAKNFILDNQNIDGGWSWSASGTSDSNDTAAAIMALLELDFDSSSIEIVNALDYLKSTQNEDGGFAYDIDSQSDGASTAWIIAALNKASIDSSTWLKGSNTPVSFLESLRQDDGSFLWLAGDEQGSSMVTAYSLLALTGGTYPVNYISITTEVEPLLGHSLRIEGPNNTICLANNLKATTVLELLEVGSIVCDFEYISQDSAYGVYISSIGGIAGAGLEGWQYSVDWQAGTVAVADYILEGNQEVLWAYGGWPFYPVKLEVNNTNFDSNSSLLASFTYYNGESWLPLVDSDIVFAGDIYKTDSLGQFSFTLTKDGIFQIFSKQFGEYMRSNKEYIIVGSGVSQVVDLSVNIESDGGPGPGGEDVIAFSVDKSNIDFGVLNPGESVDTVISLSNIGNVDVYIEASVIGNKAFLDFTSLDQVVWEDYNLNLASAVSQSVNVGLSIPNDFESLGQKEGQLIFWGTNQ